jgi:hypothetical protein
MPDNDQGNPDNITNEDFIKAAKADQESVEQAKRNTLELLEKELGRERRS